MFHTKEALKKFRCPLCEAGHKPTKRFIMAKKKSPEIQYFANLFGITYDQLMSACSYVVKNNKPAKYPGTNKPLEVSEQDMYDLWLAWSDETGHEFDDTGLQYAVPECPLF